MDIAKITSALAIMGLPDTANVTHILLHDIDYQVKPGESVLARQVKNRASAVIAAALADLHERIDVLEHPPIKLDHI